MPLGGKKKKILGVFDLAVTHPVAGVFFAAVPGLTSMGSSLLCLGVLIYFFNRFVGFFFLLSMKIETAFPHLTFTLEQ